MMLKIAEIRRRFDALGSGLISRSIVIVMVLALMTSCQSLDELGHQFKGTGPQFVVLPQPENVFAQKTALKAKIKVRKIQISGPRKGVEILSSSVTSVSGGGLGGVYRQRHSAKYMLQDDFHIVVRSALASVYEIDPKATMIALVNTKIRTRSTFNSFILCSSWKIRATVRLDIQHVQDGEIPRTEAFDGDVSEDICPVPELVPEPEDIGRIITRALKDAVDKINAGSVESELLKTAS